MKCNNIAEWGYKKNEPLKCIKHKDQNMFKTIKENNYFRNSLTIVMINNENEELTLKKKDINKKINLKISTNGKFQITGCKTELQVQQSINFFWDYIKTKKNIYNFKNIEDKSLICIFIPAMRNIDFNLGFLINREKLNTFINVTTPYRSLLETSFGYTGVNIKIPITINFNNFNLLKLIYQTNNQNSEASEEDNISKTYIKYINYLNLKDIKEKEKKMNKIYYNTFLVFHSGKIIMSGINKEYMIKTYYEFMNIIKNNYTQFEEIK